MNWKWIIQLSLFGLLMGVATVSIIPSNIEPLFWGVIFVVSAYFIAMNCREKLFLHGFLLGIANTIWVTVIHLLWFDRYVANHPEELAMMANFPTAGSLTLTVTLMGVVFGVVSGVLLGLFAAAAGRFVKRG
jgi:hypothetical protein